MNRHLGSLGFVTVAIGFSLGCYLVSAHVGAERVAVASLRVKIARDLDDMRALDAELHTRARLPQLQRWNDQTLAMAAPAPRQMLGAAVQLAAYLPGEAAPAAVSHAVVADAPAPPPPRALIAAQLEGVGSPSPHSASLRIALPLKAGEGGIFTLSRLQRERDSAEGAGRGRARAHSGGPAPALLAARAPGPPPADNIADLTQAIGRELHADPTPVQRVALR